MRNKWKLFLSNGILLSLVNIIMRGIGVSFNAYLTRKIGAESMGLFTLVMSVYGFAVTVALSCVNLGAVKLTSERCASLIECDKQSWHKSMGSVVKTIVIYSLIFGVTSGTILYISSNFISEYFLNDIRTVKSLKILALSLPAISLSSAFSGFFTGLRKVIKNAVVAVSEQFIKIFVTSTALVFILPGNIESACLAVVGGSAIAEALSLIINIAMFIFDTRKPVEYSYGTLSNFIETKLKNIFDISLPSAVGTYARQGLTTLEHLAIPKGMRRSGMTQEAALASYGLIQGIAFPLVMFPYAVIGSFTSLLIPEVSENNELKNYSEIYNITDKVYKYSAIFSVCACGVFANFSAELGNIIFGSTEGSIYTLLLGLLVPFMYLDTAVDSLLKGLGEQVYTMKINIVDSAAGLLLVTITTPLLGIYGYILTIWICEIGNLVASIHKLGRMTGNGIKKASKHYRLPLIVCIVMSLINFLLANLLPMIRITIFISGYSLVFIMLSIKKKNEKYRNSI